MVTEEIVREALKGVYDPEVSLSVEELGLIYEVNCEGTHVHVKHTLTSMTTVAALEGVESVNRELVFDPPFSIDMVPEDTRMIMGWF